MPKLLSVNRGLPREIAWQDKVARTAGASASGDGTMIAARCTNQRRVFAGNQLHALAKNLGISANSFILLASLSTQSLNQFADNVSKVEALSAEIASIHRGLASDPHPAIHLKS
jgi:ABC-type antimicrobial peptide transport system ATPase subunit